MPTSAVPGSTLAAQMAVEDSGLAAKGWKIDIISGDHQNKPDIGTTIARQWFDVDKVDVIVDVPNSGVALAVNNVVKEKNGIYDQFRRGDLRPHQRAVLAEHHALDLRHLHAGPHHRPGAGEGRRRHLVLPDRRLRLRRGARARHHGGHRRTAARCVGGVKHPLNTPDFSSFLLQAQASKAKIIGLANAGGDTTNSIKQAAEFGIVKGGQKLAGAAAVPHRRQCARAQDRAGPELHRDLLLGHERRDPGVLQALLRAHEEQAHADHGAGRRLCGPAALLQGAGSARRQSA